MEFFAMASNPAIQKLLERLSSRHKKATIYDVRPLG